MIKSVKCLLFDFGISSMGDTSKPIQCHRLDSDFGSESEVSRTRFEQTI